MDPKHLALAAIEMRRLNEVDRMSVWGTVFNCATTSEGVTHFWWDPTAATPVDEQVHILRQKAPPHKLVAVDDLGSLVVAVGTKVLSVSLVSHNLWVASISDWGDGIDVLFSKEAWRQLKEVLERFDVDVDVAQASMRPAWRNS